MSSTFHESTITNYGGNLVMDGNIRLVAMGEGTLATNRGVHEVHISFGNSPGSERPTGSVGIRDAGFECLCLPRNHKTNPDYY